MYLGLILHPIADIFASGRSPVKIFLLIAGLVVALAIVRNRKSKPKISLKKPSRIYAAFFVALGIAFAGNLFATGHAYSALGLGPGRLIVAVAERDISVTHYFHSHILKSAFGVLSGYLPAHTRLALEWGTDFGYSYGLMFPWIGYIGLVILVALVGLAVMALIRFIQGKPRIGAAVLSAVALVAVLKNVFDGGFLDHETIPALIVLGLLFYGEGKGFHGWAVPLALALIPFVAISVGLATGALAMAGALEYIRHSYGLLFIYIGWFHLSLPGPRRKGPFGSIALIIAGVLCMLPVVRLSFDGVFYAQTNLSGQEAYVATYTPAYRGEGEHSFIEKIGNLSIFRVATSAPLTIGDIATRSHDPVSYYPVSLQTVACARHDAGYESSFLVLSREPLSNTSMSHRFANVIMINFVAKKDGWNRYEASVRLSDCAPRALTIIAELFKEAGGKEFVLAPLIIDSRLIY